MFKSLPGFEEIEANEEGIIRWVNGRNPVKLSVRGHRYYLKYYPNGAYKQHKNISPYKLIATLFVPNPHEYKFVKPVDGDPMNLKASNLCWFKTSRGN